MSAEMKACPFCGGKPHSRTDPDLDGFGRFYWFECGGCKARSGEKFATETCPQFYEEVRDAWNRRTDLSQAAVAAALEAAAAACTTVADEAKSYHMPQMAVGATTARDAMPEDYDAPDMPVTAALVTISVGAVLGVAAAVVIIAAFEWLVGVV